MIRRGLDALMACSDSKPQEPPDEKQVKKPPEEKQASWSIDETKSPTDGSPQVVAANLVGDTVLILRCKEQTTEAAFSTKYNYLGYKSVDVQLRINDQNPTKEVWKASMDGRAAFAPDEWINRPAVQPVSLMEPDASLRVHSVGANGRWPCRSYWG